MNIALVAHDNLKTTMIEWANKNKEKLVNHYIYATGTTGSLLQKEGFKVDALKSGPLGGDQQIGSLIVEKKIDILFFFVDPLSAQPHEPDITALRRICDVCCIPIATNESTANFIIESKLFNKYSREFYEKDGELFLH